MTEWEKLSESARREREQKGMAAWLAWAEKNQQSILDGGSPLGKTKKVDLKGVSATVNALCAYTIVEAETHEDAAKIFLDHPHFKIFPGDSIEILECLPVPGQN